MTPAKRYRPFSVVPAAEAEAEYGRRAGKGMPRLLRVGDQRITNGVLRRSTPMTANLTAGCPDEVVEASQRSPTPARLPRRAR
jgi:hypothetical protein